MRAIVLVGGFGTRLRPLTLTTPKQMLPVADRPMIEHVVGHLGAHGVTEAILSLGYRPDVFTAAYPDGRCAGVPLAYVVEPEPLDTAGAIRFAADETGIEETVVVVNGDVLTDLDLGDLVSFHRSRGAAATISLTKVDDPSRFGVVPTDADGRVTAFVEKPPPGEAPTDLVNAGTYVLEPSVLAGIEPGRPTSLERETFPALVAAGRLYARSGSGYWLDTGTPAQLLQASLDLLDGVRPGGPSGRWVGPGAVVEGTVERSVLGVGCRVDRGAVVRDSVLLADVHVAADARVTGSVLGRGATVGVGSVVEELSVLGDGVTVADGDRLTSARVPEPDGS